MDCKSVERDNVGNEKIKEELSEDKLKILSSFGEKGEKAKLNKILLKNSGQDHKKIKITLSPNYREGENKNSLTKTNNFIERDSIQNSIKPSTFEVQNLCKPPEQTVEDKIEENEHSSEVKNNETSKSVKASLPK